VNICFASRPQKPRRRALATFGRGPRSNADSKLILSWAVGGRDVGYALALMGDLRSRITTRVQLTTDGRRAYLEAVEEAFGADIEYGMLVKLCGAETGGQGRKRKYSPSECIGAREERITGNPDPKPAESLVRT
jgi:hypothetical protein